MFFNEPLTIAYAPVEFFYIQKEKKSALVEEWSNISLQELADFVPFMRMR